MNILVPVLGCLPVFLLGYWLYAKHIEKLFRRDDQRPTPAHALKDDVDYVPTKPFVLFGHHFASIAGGGPVVGPTLALLYGFAPVWLWIVLGAVFFGAVHDMGALFASVREKGHSMAEVARRTLGRGASLCFLAFTIIMLLMLTSVFLKLTAASLTSLIPVSQFGLGNTALPVAIVQDGGVAKYVIGGIASTSVCIITCFAPLLGYLLYKRNLNVAMGSLLCIAVAIVSLVVGFYFPVRMNPTTWATILSFYTIAAAGLPVWIVLQPRDFTNVFLLYGGMGILFVSALAAGFSGLTINAPMANLAEGSAKAGPIFPLLFITVACGAISGFHALVSGGTSAKQVDREGSIRKIGFIAMLLEGFLAVLVLTALAAGLAFPHYVSTVYPEAGMASNPILGYAMGMGGLLHAGLGINPVIGAVFGILMVEGFVVTTLDTAVRLNRYLLEELWALVFKQVPGLLKRYYFNSFLCVLAMYLLAQTNTIMELWKVFGSANQLLAALTLIAVSGWLALRGRRSLAFVLPAAFMMAVTVSALSLVLFGEYIPKRNWALAGASALLLVLAVAVMGMTVKFVRELKARKGEAAI